jgi:hypothetical protein
VVVALLALVAAFVLLGLLWSGDATLGILGSSAPCTKGVGHPIPAEGAQEALRAHGFSAENTGFCGGAADIVADLKNSGDAADREGFVGCSVRRVPIYHEKYGPGFQVLPPTERQAAHWVQENVECALYVRSDPQRELARLRAAMLAMGQDAR